MKHLNLTDLYYNRLPQIEKNIFSDTENIIITAADHIDNDYDDNDNLMLTKFNLSDIDGFDSKNNFKDRILLFHLRLINRIDTYIYADQPITDVENEIEHRRSKGMKTNLKKSEFKVITKIILGARLCDPLEYGANLSVVIFVVTKPDDFHLRSLIRSTWASKFQSNSNTSRLYFVFGRIMRQKLFDFRKIDEMIRQENDHFNDIIQWNYSEDYFRLTIKSMAIVRWASIYCPLAVNVFKVDADALINYDNFIEFCQKLKQNYQYNQQNNNAARFAIYGNLWNNTAVIRLQKNKFFTSFHDFPKKFYPLYTGSAWLMNGRSSCLFIYLAAIQQSMPALLWEDIYITGIVPEKLEKISKIPFKRYQMPGFQFNVKPKHIDQCIYNRSIIFTEQMKETNLQSIWNHVNNNSVEQTITDSNHTPLSCKFQLN
uniref:Hexosyltransferase n=1 Tax=Dermatophagoides pteronyssinus TaxID=6956 RepID=A0A6P6YE53_DERPT|nr:putative UDP-GlcNAc:betaGal beta-1,3-N-acetylglucosaminyltransferase LOC100288842 [Dermatophagoides pteronyssinus]